MRLPAMTIAHNALLAHYIKDLPPAHFEVTEVAMFMGGWMVNYQLLINGTLSANVGFLNAITGKFHVLEHSFISRSH